MKQLKKWMAVGLALLLALSLTACGGNSGGAGGSGDTGEETAEENQNAANSAMMEAETALENQGDADVEVPEGTPAAGGTIYVQGYEWGPGVPKLILELPADAAELDGENALAVRMFY